MSVTGRSMNLAAFRTLSHRTGLLRDTFCGGKIRLHRGGQSGGGPCATHRHPYEVPGGDRGEGGGHRRVVDHRAGANWPTSRRRWRRSPRSPGWGLRARPGGLRSVAGSEAAMRWWPMNSTLGEGVRVDPPWPPGTAVARHTWMIARQGEGYLDSSIQASRHLSL
jgi:hypothetical protein